MGITMVRLNYIIIHFEVELQSSVDHAEMTSGRNHRQYWWMTRILVDGHQPKNWMVTFVKIPNMGWMTRTYSR